MEFSHIPVLLDEVINALNINPNGIYVDCTAGGGGHSEAIAKRLKNGKLICIDQDSDAINACQKRLSPFSENVTIIHDNFRNLDAILDSVKITKIDGLLADLGVSSHHFDDSERGFSYSVEGPLDMRMNRENSTTASEVINSFDENELKKIFSEYGEEKFAGRIASAIVKKRGEKPFHTTLQLAECVVKAIPPESRQVVNVSAKRVFQALRIFINDELEIIPSLIHSSVNRLNLDGKIAIITFHSLEDRAVKTSLAECAKGCKCPKNLPCVCGQKPLLKLLKPITPSEMEIGQNSRSRSATLRVGIRI